MYYQSIFSSGVKITMYVCMYACMYVYVYVCMYYLIIFLSCVKFTMYDM